MEWSFARSCGRIDHLGWMGACVRSRLDGWSCRDNPGTETYPMCVCGIDSGTWLRLLHFTQRLSICHVCVGSKRNKNHLSTLCALSVKIALLQDAISKLIIFGASVPVSLANDPPQSLYHLVPHSFLFRVESKRSPWAAMLCHNSPKYSLPCGNAAIWSALITSLVKLGRTNS